MEVPVASTTAESVQVEEEAAASIPVETYIPMEGVVEGDVGVEEPVAEVTIPPAKPAEPQVTLHPVPSQENGKRGLPAAPGIIYDKVPAGPLQVNNRVSGIYDRSMIRYDSALQFLDQVRVTFAQDHTSYAAFLELMRDIRVPGADMEGILRNIVQLFGAHRHLIEGFNQFLPAGFSLSAINPPTVSDSRMFADARDFVQKVRERFKDQSHLYISFLEILKTYHLQQCSVRDILENVSTLLEGHDDLIEEFNLFVPANRRRDAGSSNVAPPKPAKAVDLDEKRAPSDDEVEEEVGDDDRNVRATTVRSNRRGVGFSIPDHNFFFRARSALSEDHYLNLLRLCQMYSDHILNREELAHLSQFVFGPDGALGSQFLTLIGLEGLPQDYEPVVEEEEVGEEGAEADADPEVHGPSYTRGKPSDVVLYTDSLSREVLNNNFVSRANGREDHDGGAHQKNIHEERLFKVEEERYGLDIMLEVNASAMKAILPLLKQLKKLIVAKDMEGMEKFTVEGDLKLLHYVAIRRVYGSKGQEMEAFVRSQPAVALPMVYKRMKEMDQQWRELRVHWDREWNKINAENFELSLDHQSDCFKAVDKKKIKPKALLAEIKKSYRDSFRAGGNLSAPHMVCKQYSLAVIKTSRDLLIEWCKFRGKLGDEKLVETLIRIFVLPMFLEDASDLNSVRKAMGIEVRESKRRGREGKRASKKSKVNSGQERRILGIDDEAEVEVVNAQMDELDAFVRLPYFVGDTQSYYVIRLVDILCERVALALELSVNGYTQDKWGKSVLELDEEVEGLTGEEKYSKFLTVLNELICGDCDGTEYEIACRKYLGVHAYPLYNILRVLEGAHVAMVEMMTSPMLDLMMEKHMLCSMDSFVAPVDYFLDGKALFRESQRSFIFALDDETDRIAIQMQSPEDRPAYISLTMDGESWTKYVQEFLHGEIVPVSPRQNHIFLERTLNRNASMRVIQNLGLSAKISLSTYRIFFVSDTEDVFYRPGSYYRARRNGVRHASVEDKKQYLEAILAQKFNV